MRLAVIVGLYASMWPSDYNFMIRMCDKYSRGSYSNYLECVDAIENRFGIPRPKPDPKGQAVCTRG